MNKGTARAEIFRLAYDARLTGTFKKGRDTNTSNAVEVRKGRIISEPAAGKSKQAGILMASVLGRCDPIRTLSSNPS